MDGLSVRPLARGVALRVGRVLHVARAPGRQFGNLGKFGLYSTTRGGLRQTGMRGDGEKEKHKLQAVNSSDIGLVAVKLVSNIPSTQ